MLTAYKEFWKRYVDFTGRSTRSEYWYATLANFLIGFVLVILSIIVFIVLLSATFQGSSLPDTSDIIGNIGAIFGSFGLSFFVFGIFLLATFIPQLAITVRRLRDAGYHWAFIFLAYVPGFFSYASDFISYLAFPCQIALIVLLCQPTKYESGQGNVAPNQGTQPYGQPQPFEQNTQNFNQPSQSFGQAQQPQPYTQENQNVNQAPVHQVLNADQQTNQSSDQAGQNGQAQAEPATQTVENVQPAEPFGQAFSQVEENSAPQAEETTDTPTNEE